MGCSPVEYHAGIMSCIPDRSHLERPLRGAGRYGRRLRAPCIDRRARFGRCHDDTKGSPADQPEGEVYCQKPSHRARLGTW